VAEPAVMETAPTSTENRSTIVAPYAARVINLTFQLGTGSFGETGANQLTISGLRVIVHIEFANAPTTGNAQIRVFGMTLDHMKQLTSAGLVYAVKQDSVLVQAGDAITGMATVFNGIIIEAYPDMRSQPNGSFYIFASPGGIIQLKPVKPNSFPGAVQASQVLSVLAQQAGLSLVDKGVKAVLASPYFPGTLWDQIGNAIRAADCFAYLDGINKKLVIWPKQSIDMSSGGTVLIAPETGMIGYPEFQKNNIRVRTLFNTAIQPNVSMIFQVKSQLSTGKYGTQIFGSGQFIAINQTYDLASQMPDGPWEATIEGYPVG
jgi:baseplate hub protein gp41